jgi:hypothetical protein
MATAIGFVESLQFFTKAVDLDPNNGIRGGVKVAVAPQRLNSDVVLLEITDRAFEVPGANVLQ